MTCTADDVYVVEGLSILVGKPDLEGEGLLFCTGSVGLLGNGKPAGLGLILKALIMNMSKKCGKRHALQRRCANTVALFYKNDKSANYKKTVKTKR